MSNEQLRECPFCGGESALKGGKLSWFVVCTKCHIYSPSLQDDAHYERDTAIATWNQRANDAMIATLRDKLAEAQAWQPVSYDDIYTPLALPLRPDYEVLCEKWFDFYSGGLDVQDGYEYAVCRRLVEEEKVNEKS